MNGKLGQDDKLGLNVKAAEEAEEIFQLFEQTNMRFFERMVELCQGKIVKPAPKKYSQGGNKAPMSEPEAIRFEAEQMEWGKYQGKEIGQIDPEYLVWLTEGNTFTDKLKRYVNSLRFAQRMKTHEPIYPRMPREGQDEDS